MSSETTHRLLQAPRLGAHAGAPLPSAASVGFLRREPAPMTDDDGLSIAQLRQMVATLAQEREQALYDRQFRALRRGRRMVLLGKAR